MIPPNKPALLLVDDEERILRSLAMLFRGQYQLHTTTDAREALAIVERTQIHVIVSDQKMPIMRGAENVWPDIGIVIVEALPETIAERMNFVLSKGFRLFDIVDQCYYYGMFAQVDLVFIADRLMDNPNLRPWWSKPLSWDEWRSVAGYESVIQSNAADKR